ncbi:hypothetical protein N7G274_002398 [Stereocaulon virgatum]|uniref:Rhodopsin domain-containing protein n=1 Tax=Stereocaulon virgatum TaxID=373712 RepID=A0ABR4AJI1_9LECA
MIRAYSQRRHAAYPCQPWASSLQIILYCRTLIALPYSRPWCASVCLRLAYFHESDMANPQALSPSSLGGDPNRAPTLIAVSVISLGIALLLVALRLYVRVKIIRKVWWDELFVVLGLLIAIIVFAFGLVGVRAGIGRHMVYLPLDHVIRAAKYIVLVRVIISLSTMFTRISIGFLLLRISSSKKWLAIAVYCVMGVVVVAGVSSVFLVVGQCRPFAKSWDPEITGTCWSDNTQLAFSRYNGVVSIASDMVLALLPTVFLWNVQIAFRIKFGICCLMSLGVFTGICAIPRTILTPQLVASDITWNIVDESIWATLEAHVGIIAACIPTLKPLSKVFSSTLVTIRQRYSRRSGYISQTENDQPLENIRNSRPFRFSRTKPKPSIDTSDRESVSPQRPNAIMQKTEVHMTISDEEEQLGRAEQDYCVFPGSRELYP